MLNCPQHSNLQTNPQETVDHAPAVGYSSGPGGSAPRRGQAGAVRDLIWCQAVPRTFATVLPPSMLLLPYKFPIHPPMRDRQLSFSSSLWGAESLRSNPHSLQNHVVFQTVYKSYRGKGDLGVESGGGVWVAGEFLLVLCWVWCH